MELLKGYLIDDGSAILDTYDEAPVLIASLIDEVVFPKKKLGALVVLD